MKAPIDDYSPLLKVMREAAGLSQQAAADLLGIARNNLSALERGRQEPSPATRKRLQDVYGKRLMVIIEDVDSHV